MANQSSARLATKIASPIIRSLLVKRARLVDVLRAGMKRKLSLVVAPAGYGKTTLLGEWLASTLKEGWPAAWLTLDDDDNNSLGFWGYLADALASINPEWQFELPRIGEASGDEISHQLLAAWINRIDATPTPFSLILDDYHTIQLDSIHKDLLYFITHMPQHMHLVIASRVRPKFPLAELRVKNQLVEISHADMTFSANECETFLRQVMGLDLSAEEVAVLARATEGWVAGLQMAALSIKNEPDASQWIHRFSGSQGYIFDYLTEAVLDVQDEPIQDFLLRTSVLTELSAPLCDYLLGTKDSQARLEYLETTNLFITPLDEERSWYRYHALFADILKTRLERKHPQSLRGLHLRAATWLGENGFPEKAIPHAISAGDLELASTIIEKSAPQVISRLDFATLRRWLSYLPDEYLWRRPVFWVYRGLIETSLGNLDLVEEMLAWMGTSLDVAGEQELSAEDRATLRRDISAIQAAVDLQSGNFAQGISLAMLAIDNLPEGDSYIYGWLNHYLGYAFESADELESAIASFVRGFEFALKHEMPEGYIWSKCEIGRIRRSQGRLREAERSLRQGLDYANQAGVARGYIQFSKLALGDALIEQNQFGEASDWVFEAAAYFKQVDVRQLGWLYAIKVYTYLASYYLQVDPVEAKNYLQKARREVRDRTPFSFIMDILTDLQVRIWLADGDLGAALRWVEKKLALLEKGGRLEIAEQVALTRILLAQGKPEKAAPLLLDAEQRAHETGRGERVIEALILQALAYHHLGEAERSLAVLARALTLAEPEGFIRIFANEGTAVKILVSRVLTHLTLHRERANAPPSKRYIERILFAFDRSPQLSRFTGSHKPHETATTSPLVEPLSDRELEILAYLKEGKSNKEIAVLLVISYHTVKVHVRHIFDKLDVHDRKEAADRAAQLNLLS